MHMQQEMLATALVAGLGPCCRGQENTAGEHDRGSRPIADRGREEAARAVTGLQRAVAGLWRGCDGAAASCDGHREMRGKCGVNAG